VVDQALEYIYRTIRVLGSVLLATIIILTCVDVFMRYVFHDPVYGSNDMIQFLLAGMVFCGIAMVTFHRSHIVVTIFEPALLKMIPRTYRAITVLSNLFGIVLVAFLVIRFTDFQYQMHAETDTLFMSWGHLGVGLSILSVIGVAFGIRAMSRPRRFGSFRPYRGAIVADLKPALIELEEAQKYAWCACGLSKKQPFCDGSHKTTDMKPLLFKADRSEPRALCTCKQSNNAPYCNGTHNDIGGIPEAPKLHSDVITGE